MFSFVWKTGFANYKPDMHYDLHELRHAWESDQCVFGFRTRLYLNRHRLRRETLPMYDSAADG